MGLVICLYPESEAGMRVPRPPFKLTTTLQDQSQFNFLLDKDAL